MILGLLLSSLPGTLKAWELATDSIKSDLTWSGTVQVMESILIQDDVTLTIDAGTRVEFQGHYHIEVLGTILAKGTEQDTIVFTPADTGGFWNDTITDGSWDGITFNNGATWGGADGAMTDNDTSIFNYCRIEFTKTVEGPSYAYSAIEIVYFSNLVISNCEIRYNRSIYRGGAIGASTESDVSILGNHIHHNRSYDYGGGIYLRNNAALVRGNIIEYNTTTGMEWNSGRGGGIGILGMSPVIENNIIRNNSALFGAGIYMTNCFGRIENNTITYNECYNELPDVEGFGGGISANNGSTAKIINNRFSDNQAEHGGGIYVGNADVSIFGNLIVNNTGTVGGGGIEGTSFSGEIVNNTLVSNYAPNGGAVQLEDAEPLFANNIIWNNYPDPENNQMKLLGYFSDLHILNSVLQYGLSGIWGESQAVATNLITDPPGLREPVMDAGAGNDGLSGKWWLLGNSVCINAGYNDYTGKIPEKDNEGYRDRVLHSIIDIGAYERWVWEITAQDTIKTNTTWIADVVKVNNDVVILDDVVLTILPGTRVEFTDTFRIQVIGSLIASGEPEKRIVFTVDDTSGHYDMWSPDGSWQGVHFHNDLENLNAVMDDNEPSILNYCDFSFVKGLGEYNYHKGAALTVRYFDKLYISNCRFYNNQFGYEAASIDLFKADLVIKNCEFFNNFASQGPAIWVESSNLKVEDCDFHDNYSMHWGGAMFSNGGDLSIKNSEFRYNSSGDRAGAIYMARTKALISHSWFENNYANGRGGAIAANYENFQLVNNILVNNTGGAGGALYCLYVDEAITMNNTICNNGAVDGGGIYNAFANHTSINDIIYGNDAGNSGKQYNLYSVAADLIFKNTNLQGGTDEIGFYIGQELTGTFENVIDSFPNFIRPTEGPGSDYYAGNARWLMRSISPCINSGTVEGPAYLVDVDIQNNPRIFDSIIDIGAIESQYGPPRIQVQPDNYIGCAGDTLGLETRARHESNYQWQKDGENIPGATESVLMLENLSDADDGNYLCIVSNSLGSVKTNSVYVLARSAPKFIRQPENVWAIEGEKTILSSTGIGTAPIHFQWYKDGMEISNQSGPDLLILNPVSIHEGLYHCEASNSCATVSSDTVQLYMAPQICMVTVDTTDGNNLIIWEKNSVAPIASYNIHRESIVAGEYDAIGNVTGDALSEFTDTVVNPAQQAYIYKLTAIMADGRESDINLCKPHRTIHLLTSKNTELKVAQLDWDDYYGFEYGTFYIFRHDADRGDFLNYHSMPSSTNEWTDAEAESGKEYYYRVAVEPPRPCNPTGNEKAKSGPYNHSLSNMDDNKLKVGTGVGDVIYGGLKIYPNPFNQSCSIEFPNNELSEYRITVRDLSGKVVWIEKTRSSQIVIERGEMAAGIYSIELSGKKIFRDKFIVE